MSYRSVIIDPTTKVAAKYRSHSLAEHKATLEPMYNFHVDDWKDTRGPAAGFFLLILAGVYISWLVSVPIFLGNIAMVMIVITGTPERHNPFKKARHAWLLLNEYRREVDRVFYAADAQILTPEK